MDILQTLMPDDFDLRCEPFLQVYWMHLTVFPQWFFAYAFQTALTSVTFDLLDCVQELMTAWVVLQIGIAKVSPLSRHSSSVVCALFCSLPKWKQDLDD